MRSGGAPQQIMNRRIVCIYCIKTMKPNFQFFEALSQSFAKKISGLIKAVSFLINRNIWHTTIARDNALRNR